MKNEKQTPDAFCHFCGAKRADASKTVSTQEPQMCSSCGEIFYKNPKPVAVLIVPTGDGGIYLVRRGIDPHRGRLALPGGYVEEGESWQKAAVREAGEELDLHFFRRHETEVVKHLYTESTPDGKLLLIGGYATIVPEKPTPFRPSDEVMERVVYYNEYRDYVFFDELCFPLHAKFIEGYFALREAGRA